VISPKPLNHDTGILDDAMGHGGEKRAKPVPEKNEVDRVVGSNLGRTPTGDEEVKSIETQSGINQQSESKVFIANTLNPGVQTEQRASLITGGQVMTPNGKVPNTPDVVTLASAQKFADDLHVKHVLMRLPGTLSGADVLFLIDCGGTHNFVSSSVVEKAAVIMDKSGSQSVMLGDGEAHVEILGTIKGSVRIGTKYEDQIEFQVMKSHCDCAILGMPWLYDQNPRIDWRARTISPAEDGSGSFVEPLVADLNGQQDKNDHRLNELVLSERQLRRALKKSTTKCYLGFISAMDVPVDESTKEAVEKSFLSGQGQSRLVKLLQHYADVFPDRLPGLPPSRGFEHEIRLMDDEPVHSSPYRLSPLERTAMRQQITEMLELGLIQPSRSPYGSPILFVKKGDGSLRMVIDYRRLNSKTIKDRFPLPRIPDLVDRLQNAKFFTKMDLQQGYYQVRVKEEDVFKTAFVTPEGQYELKVMPMGQSNSVATFQRLMAHVFPFSQFGNFVVCYLDDILVFSDSEDAHLSQLSQVFERLREMKLFVKRSKCSFGRQEMSFVGQVVGHGRRKIDPEKAQLIRSFPVPRNCREVRSFYGLVNFCRDFLPGLSTVAAPLTDLTKKYATFEWMSVHQRAFDAVRNLVADAIELTIPNPEKPYILQTDASDVGLGATLLQPNEQGSLVPVGVTSRKLINAERDYPTHEKEMLAIVWGLREFRHYIEGLPVTVQTDHCSLRFVNTQPHLSRRMARWVETLQQYDLTIQYKRGDTNTLADLLSRDIAAELNLREVGLANDNSDFSSWPDHMADFLTLGPASFPDSLRDLLEGQAQHFEFDEEVGLLYRVEDGSRLRYIPFVARADYVYRWHTGSGHLGWEALYNQVRHRAWWPGMRGDMKTWVQHCPECQIHSRNILQRHEEAHIIQPMPRTLGRWYIDWIGPLPETESGNKWIWTAVEETCRWPIACAVKDATAVTAARLLYQEIVVSYGTPEEVVTDRGRNFLAEQLQSYLEIITAKHLKTSAYHPRTNGKVENYNGLLGKMLSKCVKGARHKWDEFIPEALFNTRVRIHTTTGYSPFFLLYGVEPRVPGDTSEPYVLDQRDPKDLAEIRAQLLEGLDQDRAAAMERCAGSAAAAKIRYDVLVRRDPLRVGDWVLLRRGQRLKFMSTWLGPYQVHRLGPSGTYQLRAPDGTVKEDLVHRDRLKRCLVNTDQAPTSLWSDEELLELDQPFTGVGAGFGQEGYDIVPVDARHLPSGTVPSTLEAGGGVREEALGGVSDGS
jgi:transposase InsO family protein